MKWDVRRRGKRSDLVRGGEDLIGSGRGEDVLAYSSAKGHVDTWLGNGIGGKGRRFGRRRTDQGRRERGNDGSEEPKKAYV